MGDEDLLDFNPRKYWAEINHEKICKQGIGFRDLGLINKLVDYLESERTIEEMINSLKMTRGEIVRLFGIIRDMKSISLERIDSKGVYGYRIKDFRKPK